MPKRVVHVLSSVLGVLLFGSALWVIVHQLRQYELSDVLWELLQIPRGRLIASLALIVLDYTVLTGYEFLSLAFIGKKLSYGKTALASFIAHTFSVNINLLAGSALRYRVYATWGLTRREVATMIVFCNVTFVLGYLAVAGIIFAVPSHAGLPLPVASGVLRPLGLLFLSLVAAYLMWNSLRHTRFRVCGWDIPRTTVALSLRQISWSALDWLLAGAALYLLLPPALGIGFLSFLALYLLAQLAGQMSQAPAGLGVFEASMLLLLSPLAHHALAVVGALLAYRLLYYLLPFLAAVGMLAAQEVRAHRLGCKSVLCLGRARCSAVAVPVYASSARAYAHTPPAQPGFSKEHP